MQATHTNNDVEGWHHRLNQKVAGRCGIPFYMLIDLLHKEASLVVLTIQLVSEGKVSEAHPVEEIQIASRAYF